jgi:crotonobetainyl-CoA:carnitine CoA-transferase CaiB-like acyl-CoA transferase
MSAAQMNGAEQPRGALTGLRIVEVVGGVPAAYCGRLYADLGAEVILAGAPKRPELSPTSLHPLSSGLWQALHRNKGYLDIEPRQGDAWRDLLASADAVIVEANAGELGNVGLDRDLPEHLVVVAISHFGQTGPLSSWSGTDLIDSAYGGGCNQNGEPGRAPLRPPAFVGDHEVGLNAALAGLVALQAGRRVGGGQLVDVSAVDSWATIQTGVALLEYMFQGRVERRQGRNFVGRGYPYTTLRTKDGELRLICIQGREWARALEMMGNPDWAQDARYANRLVNQEQYADELDELVGAWLGERTGAEVLELSLEHRVPWAPVQTLAQVLEDTQLESRKFFWDDSGTRIPGFPAQFSRTPARFVHSAPTEPTRKSPRPRKVREGAAASEGGQPLAGLRVLDFGWAWAGAVPGAVLADFGADVVKIESTNRLDPMRLDRPLIGSERDHEQGGLHHNVNRNKRSIELDLRDPGDLETVRRLVATSDVLIENLSTGVLDGLGLGYAALAEINPRLIYVSIAAVGRTGPLRDIRSYATVLTALSSVDAAVGYPDERMLGLQHGFGDPNAGLHAAFAILAAIREREESGRGQFVDLSQVESMVSLLGGQLVAQQHGADFGRPAGNRDLFMAPHGIFPTNGDDEWVAIACPSDGAWRNLRELTGIGPLEGSTLDTLEERLSHVEALEVALADWTRDRDRWEISWLLQEHGIPAAPLLTSADRFADDHLNARGDYATVDHPVVGGEVIYGAAWKLARTPARIVTAAPLLGQHTDEVLAELGDTAGPTAAASSRRAK